MGRRKSQEETIQKHVRIPKSLTEAIQIEAQKLGYSSFSDMAVELFRRGLKRSAQTETMKEIFAKYEGRCLQCNNVIKVSQKCWWASEIGVLCEDCHTENELEGIGDITLARLYARKRKLTKTNQGLKKIANEFADRINECVQKINLYGLGERHEELERGKLKLMELVEDYLKRQIGTEEESHALKEFSEKLRQIELLQNEIRKEIKEQVLTPVRKKQQRKHRNVYA